MSKLGKYKVVYFYEYSPSGSQSIEDWLNEQDKKGWELVAIDGRNYIFKRNVYIVSIKEVKND